MKKSILVLCVIFFSAGLFAEQTPYYKQYGSLKSSSSSSQPQRGYAQPGDKNYLNEQQDNFLYGKNNSYQGSRPGDSDFSERQQRDMLRRDR